MVHQYFAIFKRFIRDNRQFFLYCLLIFFVLECLAVPAELNSFGVHPHHVKKLVIAALVLLSFVGFCISAGGLVGWFLIFLLFSWEIFLLCSLYQLGALPPWYFIATAGSQETLDFWPVFLGVFILTLVVSFLGRKAFRAKLSFLIFFLFISISYLAAVDQTTEHWDAAGTIGFKRPKPHFSFKMYPNFGAHLLHLKQLSNTYPYHMMEVSIDPLTTLYATVALHFTGGRESRVINPDTLALPKGTTKSKYSSHSTKHIVLVLGESSQPKHYSSYGYKKGVTPNLSRMVSSGTLCQVLKVHSAAPITRFALLPSLTFWTPEDQKDWKKEQNLISLANKSGYKTYFISSQQELNAYAGDLASLVMMSDYVFAPDTCEPSKCQLLNPEHRAIQGDDDLIEPFRHALDDKQDKQMIILHLYGSHLPYGKRITEYERQYFPGLSEYDQTIAHTDRLLNSIYVESYKKWGRDFTLVYFSDHGEEVSNSPHAEDVSLAGHGLMKSIDQYLVPFMSNNPAICAKANQLRASDGYYSTQMNIHLLIDLLGYQTDKKLLNRQKENDEVFHANEHLYRFVDLPK